MKTFEQVVNQPTVKDGSLKTGLAVSKLANAGLDVSFSGSIEVAGKSLEIGAVIGAALLPAYDNKYDIKLDDLLSLYSSGYIIQQQANIATIIASGGATSSKKPLTAGSVLSAQDYLTGNLKTASIDTVNLYENITALLSSDKTTKQQLTDYLQALQVQLLPNSVLEVYTEKLRKESELAEQFEELTELGFSEIQPITETTYSALLSLANASALQGLTAKSYLLKDSQVDITSATIKVVFEKTITD
jgi:hypothetical protein